jgi:hypothetical protein
VNNFSSQTSIAPVGASVQEPSSAALIGIAIAFLAALLEFKRPSKHPAAILFIGLGAWGYLGTSHEFAHDPFPFSVIAVVVLVLLLPQSFDASPKGRTPAK